MTRFEWLLLRSARWLWPGWALAWPLLTLGSIWGGLRPGMHWFWLAAFSALSVYALWRWAGAVRERFIHESPLPLALKRKLRSAYPLLSAKDSDLAERALRQFFMACLRSRGRYAAMPSRAAGVMWEAFAQHPTSYAPWCRMALGHVPEYTPTQALGKKIHHNDGLRRTWYWACRDEAIDPRQPSRLPLLFALDAKLNIPDGLHYAVQALASPLQEPHGSETHYGTDFGNASYCGSATDFGGAEPRRTATGHWEVDFSAGDAGTDCSDGGGGDGGGGGD